MVLRLLPIWPQELSNIWQRFLRGRAGFVDANTIEETLSTRDESIKILNRGLFKLNKWSSNDSRILKDIYEKGRCDATDIQIDKNISSCILGILWNPSTDVFCFSIDLQPIPRTITKRAIGSFNLLFDPLGLISPVIIISKTMMQEIWQLKTHWDESIPLDIHARWSIFKNHLSDLISTFHDALEFTIIIQFSVTWILWRQPKGACIYIRNQIADNEFQIELLCSKTRVAPFKTISLPQLELCAAVLLAHY